MNDFGIAAALVVGVIALIAFGVIAGCRVAGHAHCNSYAKNTGRETKWVVYHALDTGDCLTRSADGRWIPVSQLREVTP